MAGAQTINEAGERFNQGVEMTKTEDYEGAITAFEQAVAICDQLGEEGAELKSRAVAQIPDLHYKAGFALYKAKKLDEAIQRLERASMVATEYGDNTTLAKTNKLIPQLLNAQGLTRFKKDEFDAALQSFDKAIAIDAEFAKPYLGKAYVFFKKDDADAMKEAVDMAIAKGEAAGDEKTVSSAKEQGYKGFLIKGQKAIQGSDYKAAEGFLVQAAAYDDSDANLHYLLAVTYNKLGKSDDALAEAGKAIEKEEAPDKLAAMYFELATAHEKKGDSAAACEAYSKALNGPNGAAAKYQMEEVLKCN